MIIVIMIIHSPLAQKLEFMKPTLEDAAQKTAETMEQITIIV